MTPPPLMLEFTRILSEKERLVFGNKGINSNFKRVVFPSKFWYHFQQNFCDRTTCEVGYR